ncbi:attachment protein [Pseudomonas sp. DP-17]|uniref:attachment protein n=1 Tax=Pseudomonas sp. DP-17 TaxID=1580486 RepID=UPI001EFBBCCF|nr:attachment protein [Pseudomonas sp. DP-17]MCG8906262.1 attachment protein [Pseudomonas sp. DP-17]
MKHQCHRLLLVVLLLLSAPVLAADYSWTVAGQAWTTAPSPGQACAIWAKDITYPGGQKTSFGFVSETKYWCRVAANNGTGSVTLDVWRTGNACPEGTEYDPSIKDGSSQCKAPPKDCSATQGEPFPAKGNDAPVISSGGRNYVADGGPPTACYEQCQYKSESGRSTSCYLVKGSTTQGFCNYILQGTGENCSADSYQFSTTGDPLNPTTEPPDPAVPPSDPNDPGCPEGWAWLGTTCVKTDPSNPGDGDGDGEGGGNTGGGAGGGDGSGNGDGSGSGDGDGSGSGNGDGSGSGNGDGSGSGNGDGEGEGEGQCDPAKDPNGCQGEGPGTELKEPEAGSWDEANKEWDQKVQDAKKELKDAVKANIDQLKGAFDLQLSTGGGQLPCYTGTVWGKPYSLCVSDYADQLSNMRLALLLMAALIAAFVILKE